jgi:hypothetical protein
MIENKNLQDKRHVLGQFFTPDVMVDELLEGASFSGLVIEPSFGGGAFIDGLKRNGVENIIGIEVDEEWYNLYEGVDKRLMNFYDFSDKLTGRVDFVGNVPFRTPAYSLETHNKYVKALAHKYGVTGIREEAVFFIIKTIDLLLENKCTGGVHYIIPEQLIKNNSKFYVRFKNFLKRHMTIKKIVSIDGRRFENVSQGLIFISMEVGGSDEYEVEVDGEQIGIDEVLNLNSDDIPFTDIFKKTYLGSVPAESFLVSSKGESIDKFKNRLKKIMFNPHSIDSLVNDLYAENGLAFLKILNTGDENSILSKIEQISSYIDEVKSNVDLSIFDDDDNYCVIQHRHEQRFYFRHRSIKKCSFVYELNPNPCKSFFFTSNPSDSSTDYFGYCEFDVTRNSSPGCCRTVPLDLDNIKDEFIVYWNSVTTRPISDVFEYIIHVSKSQWYRDKKKKCKRMYFCIPAQFMNDFNL